MGGGNCAILTVWIRSCLGVIYLRLTKRVNENYVSQCVDPSTMARVIAYVERVRASETCALDGKGWGGVGRGGVRLTMK